jgi:hypothetical protein
MDCTLIIVASPGGGLSYDDRDVIQVLDGCVHPGNAVVPTDSGFQFVYCTDKAVDSQEMQDLMCPMEGDLIDPEDPDMGREQMCKRCTCLVLDGAEYDTWVPAEEAAAAGIAKTWAEIQSLLVMKHAH